MSAFKKNLLSVLLLFSLMALAPAALAQGDPPARASMNGFSFDLIPALGMHLNLVQQPAGAEMVMPPQAAHTQFMLYPELPAPFNFNDAAATIFAYPVSGLAALPDHAERLAALQTLLDTRPDLSEYMVARDNVTENALPFLPVLPAGQVIRARAQYVESAALRGISYITAYAQAQEPFLSSAFLYTFQGVSADGETYISLVMPLTTGLFPAEHDPNFGVLELQADVAGYMNASVAALNEAAPGDFAPALDHLQTLLDSIAFSE
ncbi:MAG: hypothetical protein JXN59_14355 [Anaerolineae bacterium]|nr:hypothetical protein [Anaerolineae bacterium]